MDGLDHVYETSFKVVYDVCEQGTDPFKKLYKSPLFTKALNAHDIFLSCDKVIVESENEYVDQPQNTRFGSLIQSEGTIYRPIKNANQQILDFNFRGTYTLLTDLALTKNSLEIASKIPAFEQQIEKVENFSRIDDKPKLTTLDAKLQYDDALVQLSRDDQHRKSTCLFALSTPWLNHILYVAALRGTMSLVCMFVQTLHFSLVPCKVKASWNVKERPLQNMKIDFDSLYPFSDTIVQKKTALQFLRKTLPYRGQTLEPARSSKIFSVKFQSQVESFIQKCHLSMNDKKKLLNQAHHMQGLVNGVAKYFDADVLSEKDASFILKMFLSDEYLKFSRIHVTRQLRAKLFKSKQYASYVYVMYENTEQDMYYKFLPFIHELPEPLQPFFDFDNDNRVFPRSDYYFLYPTNVVGTDILLTAKDILHVVTLTRELCRVYTEEQGNSQSQLQPESLLFLDSIFVLENPLFKYLLRFLPFIRIYCFSRERNQTSQVIMFITHYFIRSLEYYLQQNCSAYGNMILCYLHKPSDQTVQWNASIVRFFKCNLPDITKFLSCDNKTHGELYDV